MNSAQVRIKPKLSKEKIEANLIREFLVYKRAAIKCINQNRDKLIKEYNIDPLKVEFEEFKDDSEIS